MRHLCDFLLENYNIYLVGLEKSGVFVEHAEQIKGKLRPWTVIIPNNEYIYKYIEPGSADIDKPYARTTYYGGKIIFKSKYGGMYVATIPVPNEKVVIYPRKEDFKNIEVILNNIQELKSDMYDNALFPVALANKLVSLAHHPSSRILEKFAIATIER